MYETHQILQVLFGISLLLLLAKVFGAIASKFKVPSIVGELLVGLLLGPTILGSFEFATHPIFQTFVQIALLCFLLSTGGHLDVAAARSAVNKSGTIAISGILVPFTIAILAITWAPSLFLDIAGPSARSDLQVALFFGLALSISAVPVIAKILMDLGLYKTNVGTIVMTAAVLTDIAAWLLYGLVGNVGGHGLLTIGAFLVGTTLAPTRLVKTATVQSFFRFSETWLAPLFFASIGLRTNFIEHFDPALVIAVFCLACAGKLIGCGVAARCVGLKPADAWSIAFGLNARGAVEIVLCLTALNQGLITIRFFESLVIMAFVTAFMSAPVIKHLQQAPYQKDPT